MSIDPIGKVKFSWADTERYPIIQGGMGIGISLMKLAAAVGLAGGMGTLSAAALDQLVSMRVGKQLTQVEAVAREVSDTKKACGYAAINIMVKAESSYEASVEGAVRGGANMIVSGAGFPLDLPKLVEKYYGSKNHPIALVPIASSVSTLRIVNEHWEKEGYAPPAAMVLAGPKCAGHLGFNNRKVTQAGENFLRDYDLFDVLLEPVLEYAAKYGTQVFVAGGIRTKTDIEQALARGAAGVQLGTPFVATHESNASDDFKQTLIRSSNKDVKLGSKDWGSPALFPFRYLAESPLAQEKIGQFFCICTALGTAMATPLSLKPGDCPEGYVKPLNGTCPAQGNVICKGLYTVGTEIDTITRLKYAREVIDDLVNG